MRAVGAPQDIADGLDQTANGRLRNTIYDIRDRVNEGSTLADALTAYLRACKLDERALSTLPPGRFLMPGDLEGSPALTFAPLPRLQGRRARSGSHPRTGAGLGHRPGLQQGADQLLQRPAETLQRLHPGAGLGDHSL